MIGLSIARSAVEDKLNNYSYCPGISTISGGIRATAAAVYTVASLVLFAMNKTSELLAPERSPERTLARMRADEWKTEAVHGLKNILRGAIESIPFIGNFILMPREHQAVIISMMAPKGF